MLRPLRRRLRRIRYYSANREETVWTRLADAALFVTLALALLMVLVCDAAVIRPTIVLEERGALDRSADGDVTARLARPDTPPVWSRDTFGNFTLEVVEESRGWPMITSIHTRPARIEYDLFHEPEKRRDRNDAEDAPMREAIGAAVLSSDHARLVETWRLDAPVRNNEPPLRWVFGVGLWWIILYIVAMFALGSSRLIALIWHRNRAARMRRLARAGFCAHCGYNLRGTEFSERCPECGELA